MSTEPDWAVLIAAGLLDDGAPDADERRELLQFLVEQGCTIDEMLDADRRGRLFGLAGDRILRPGARQYTFAEMAVQTGVDEATVRRVWRALRLPDWNSTEPVASAADIAALEPLLPVLGLFGEELFLDFARSLGAALSRVGEVVNATGRSLSPESSIATSGSTIATARYWAATAPFVAAVGQVLDVYSRHHFEGARRNFEQSDSFDLMHRRLVRLAVGFVDVSGFTAMAEHLGEDEFARLVGWFTATVSEAVHDNGGRVVKFVGDAAMIAAPNPIVLAEIVHELVAGEIVAGQGLELHAGLAAGEVMVHDGDYFGSVVNLAARLASLAERGAILATEPVGSALEAAGWRIDWRGPTPIRGLIQPIVTCAVQGSRVAPRVNVLSPP